MEMMTIDGVEEQSFREEIEDLLRFDQVDAAVERLRALVEPFAQPGGILPARFLEVTVADIEITGWDRLATRLASHDRPSQPISAIGVALSDARVLGGPGPSGGKLAPFIKTFYFTDEAYPFSDATRDDLLDGYTREGFGWHGDYQATDATLSIKGLDDLHGAVVELEDRLFDAPDAAEDEFRAGAIGACYITALIHKALRDAIRERGLPRPLCVIAACDGVYPFFDAPVVGRDECEDAGQIEASSEDKTAMDMQTGPLDEEAEAEAFVEPDTGASLLSISVRKTSKTPVLVVRDEDASEASRIYQAAAADYVGGAAEPAPEQPLVSVHTPLAFDHDADHRPTEPERLAAMIHVEPVAAEEPPLPAEDNPVAATAPEVVAPPVAEVEPPAAPPIEEPAAALPVDDVAEVAPPEAWSPQPAASQGHALRNRISSVQPATPASEPADRVGLFGRIGHWLRSLLG